MKTALPWLLGLLLAGSLAAQETVDLSRAWAIGAANNLQLAQQDKTVRLAELDVLIQRADYLPALSLSGSYGYVSELARLQLPFTLPDGSRPEIEAGVAHQYDAAVNLRQQLFSGFRTRNLVRAHREGVRSRESERQAIRNRLLLEIGMAYYDLHLNRVRHATLQQGLERVELQLQRARHRLANGQAAPFDTLEAATRKTQYRLQLQVLDNEFAVLRSGFQFLLNSSGPVTIDPERADLPLTAATDLDSQLQQALSLRPELQQLTTLQLAQTFRRKALRAAFFPQISAQASYHYARPGVNFFKDEWMDYYTVGVGLNWSLWTGGRNRRTVEQARVEEERLRLREQQVADDIRQQVISAWQSLNSLREQIVTRRALVAQEKERYRITEMLHREGQVDALDASAVESSLTEATLELEQARIRERQVRLQLAFATGEIGTVVP